MPQEPWYELDGAEAAHAAADWCASMWQQGTTARGRALNAIQRYYGQSLDSALWQNQQLITNSNIDDLPIVWNLSRSYTGALTSRIAAAQNPKLQFVTSDAQWSIRRRGQKLDQFIEALMMQPCEPYTDIHQLRWVTLRDALVFRYGCVQVEADADQGRVITERVFPWEILLDPQDAGRGTPATWGRTFAISRAALKAWYPEQADAIDAESTAAATSIELELGLTSAGIALKKNDQIVRAHHIWHVAMGPKSPGRHMIVLDQQRVALLDEEWPFALPPLIPMRWDFPLVGMWGQSLLEEIAPLEDEMNRTLQRLADCLRRTALATTWVKQGSVDKDLIDDTKDATTKEFTGDTPPITPPAAPLDQAAINWVQLQYSTSRELLGLSELAMTAEKPAGLNSGEAIRSVASQQSLRLATVSRQQEAWLIQWARCAINAVRLIAEKKKDFYVNWPGAGFLRQIKWQDVSLEDDQFYLQIRPVGELKDEPADRRQRADELLANGSISQQTYAAIISTTLDVQGETSRMSLQRELVDSYIDHWLDATPEQMQTGMWDAEKQIPLVPPPLRFMVLGDAILQVAEGYMHAELNGAPDANRQLFLDWLEMADAEMTSQEERKTLAAQSMQAAVGQAGTNAGVAQSIIQQQGAEPPPPVGAP